MGVTEAVLLSEAKEQEDLAGQPAGPSEPGPSPSRQDRIQPLGVRSRVLS